MRDNITYDLKYKNETLARFNLSADVLDIKVTSLMPIGCVRIRDLQEWLYNRSSNLERGNVNNILSGMNLEISDSSLLQLMLDNYAQSVNDCYWVAKEDDNVTYSDISIFMNELDTEVIEMFANVKHSNYVSKRVTPEFTLQGAMPKFISKENGSMYLYKVDDTTDCSENEVFCSKFLKSLGVPCVSYEKVVKFNLHCTKTKVETNLDTHWISADTLSTMCVNVEDLVIKHYRKEFCTMLLTDFLLGNVYRHKGNWSLTCKLSNVITGFAPLYDYSFAFNCKDVSKLEKSPLGQPLLDNALYAMSIVPELLDKAEEVTVDYPESSRTNYIKARVLELKNAIHSTGTIARYRTKVEQTFEFN